MGRWLGVIAFRATDEDDGWNQPEMEIVIRAPDESAAERAVGRIAELIGSSDGQVRMHWIEGPLTDGP